MGKLDGKVACITGGTRSIGRAMADAMLAEGAKVVVNGRDPGKGERCLEEMGGGDNAAFYAGDAAKHDGKGGGAADHACSDDPEFHSTPASLGPRTY